MNSHESEANAAAAGTLLDNSTARAARRTPLIALELGDFLAQEFPPREMILAPIIQEQSLTLLHAWRGTGKTHVALGIAYAIASGSEFLRWRAERPRKVLYLDGEMSASGLQERLIAIANAAKKTPPEGYFRLVTPDIQGEPMPDLATVSGQSKFDALLEDDTALIIIDNLSALARSGTENEAESWSPIANWALWHRAHQRSILFVHHSNKRGAQRGTSKREDLLDTVLTLEHPIDYKRSEGARFQVKLEKSRGLLGEDTDPFEAHLVKDEYGKQRWNIREIGDGRLAQMQKLQAQGLSMGEIGRQVGLDKSNVSRQLKTAETAGQTPEEVIN